MKKLDYLKLALTKSDVCLDKRWLVNILAITMPDENTQHEHTPYLLYNRFDGMFFVNPDSTDGTELVKIDDYVKKEPLFTVRDKMTIDNTWFANVKGSIDTQLGNVLINAIAVDKCLNSKIPFVEGRFNLSALESKIATMLIDDPLDNVFDPTEKHIYTSELIKFNDHLYFLTNISEIINITATPKNIVEAPEMPQARKKALAEYGDTIKDPVKLAELEGKLQAIDDAYLADDISSKVFIKGKVRSQGRKKLFVIFGDEAGFEEKTTADPITTALVEGWDTSHANYPKYINALRYGAFARGAETIKGGVINKTLLRAFSGFKVIPTDCGSTVGFKRLIKKDTYTNLIDRSIKSGSGWKTVKDDAEAGTYIGSIQEVRSPMYCRAKGDNYCVKCLSPFFGKNPNGITITELELGSVILGMFMAAMHGKVLSTTKVSIESMCQ